MKPCIIVVSIACSCWKRLLLPVVLWDWVSLVLESWNASRGKGGKRWGSWGNPNP